MKNFFLLLMITVITGITQAQTTAKEWYDKGKSLKTDEKYKEAVDAFKKAVSLKPSYPEALHQLGWCYNELKMYNEALDALKKEENNGPADKASTWLEIGYAYKGLKKYDDAVSYFNKAITEDPQYALAYKERGDAYYKMPDYEKALADFNKYASLETDITDADFYYDKAWCENEFKKFSEAVQSLKKCIELDDKYSDAFSELGYSYYELNLNDESLANYRIAMALDNGTDYHPILGIADVYYDNLKNYDSAIYYYEKGTQLQKKNKSAYYRLGWCYNDKEKYAEAIRPLQAAVLLDAEYDKARTELGYAYYKLDQYDNALAQLKPVMNRDSKDQLSRYYAGFCYYLKGDQDNLKRMIDQLKGLNATDYVQTLTKYVK